MFSVSRFDVAEVQLHEALAIYRANGIGGRPVLKAISPLTVILQRQNNWAELEAIGNEAIAEVRKTPGTEYPEIAGIENALVAAKIAESDYPEAERLARDALAIDLRFDGSGSTDTAWGYLALGYRLMAEKKYPEAMEAQKQAMAIFCKALPANHAIIAFPLAALNETLVDAQQSSTLMALFPTVQDVTDLEPLFIPSLGVKPLHRRSGPPIAAAKCLTTLVGSYFALSHELTTAGRIQEAQESRRRGIALLDGLLAQVVGHDDLMSIVYSGLVNSLRNVGEDQRANDVNAKLVALKQSQ